MSHPTALPSTVHHAKSLSAKKSSARCAFFTNAHRRCRLRVTDAASELCFRHFQLANLHQLNAASDPAAHDLLSAVDHFSDANSINRFLANVVRQLAYKRISRQDAVAYGYLSQLLLNTLRPLSLEHESAEADALVERITADARRLAPIRDRQQEISVSPSSSEPESFAAINPPADRPA
jgi:hypothetical protein